MHQIERHLQYGRDSRRNSGGNRIALCGVSVDMNFPASPDQLRFDLYSERMLEGDIDVKSCAPFSHDAGTRRGVPELSMALLMGVGLLAFGLWCRNCASTLGV